MIIMNGAKTFQRRKKKRSLMYIILQGWTELLLVVETLNPNTYNYYKLVDSEQSEHVLTFVMLLNPPIIHLVWRREEVGVLLQNVGYTFNEFKLSYILNKLTKQLNLKFQLNVKLGRTISFFYMYVWKTLIKN